MGALNWTCPFCGRPQTVVGDSSDYETAWVTPNSKHGHVGVRIHSIACANDECKELYLSAWLAVRISPTQMRRVPGSEFSWSLRPTSLEVSQPDHIPDPIRQDYYEACRIRDLSPKASATIARRCLQGMIRDFCGITKRTLFDEIVELRARVEAGQAPRGVSHDTIDAIDHVRSLGNIGAHMEKDINLIVDIDADEAQQLIGLLELLFVEWYVQAEERRQRLAQIGVTAAEKKAITEQKKLPAP